MIAVILTGCAAQGEPAGVSTKTVASDPNVIQASSLRKPE